MEPPRQFHNVGAIGMIEPVCKLGDVTDPPETFPLVFCTVRGKKEKEVVRRKDLDGPASALHADGPGPKICLIHMEPEITLEECPVKLDHHARIGKLERMLLIDQRLFVTGGVVRNVAESLQHTSRGDEVVPFHEQIDIGKRAKGGISVCGHTNCWSLEDDNFYSLALQLAGEVYRDEGSRQRMSAAHALTVCGQAHNIGRDCPTKPTA